MKKVFEKYLKSKSYDAGLNLAEFSSMLKSYGVCNEDSLINKLFWIFDDDSCGDLKYEELAFGIEMFNENTSKKDKLKNFFEVCDADGSGSISQFEFMELLKKNLIKSNDKADMNTMVDKIFCSVDLDQNKEITFLISSHRT